ncbi:MAG: hypothetical protein WBB45_10225 [Cyclobacteriaceae bacterium]
MYQTNYIRKQQYHPVQPMNKRGLDIHITSLSIYDERWFVAHQNLSPC